MFFPKFLTPEQCKSIIEMAKPRIKPSTLALRKGETEESTQGIRTRFVSIHLYFLLHTLQHAIMIVQGESNNVSCMIIRDRNIDEIRAF